jgi:circadian clock protein KaiB
VFKFRLFVAGDTENSAEAMANLKELCDHYLPKRYEIEIVDVYRDPRRALDDGILMTPTLLKLEPLPQRRIIGTLSKTRTVLIALGLGLESAVLN